MEVWTLFKQGDIVPTEMEYDENPRGRVTYNTKTLRFTLLADRYILHDQNLVMKIMSEMNLPQDTTTDKDSHYRCAVCLKTGSE
jgi:hypothetical protein